MRVLNDSAKAAEEGIGFAPGGLCFEKWEESPAYALETSRYVPADGARTARSAAGAAWSVVLDDPAAPPVVGATGGPAADGADAAPTEGEVSHG